MSKRLEIISGVEFGEDPIAAKMGQRALRCVVKFSGGVFSATHMEPPHSEPPPEQYTKRHCADYLTQVFRDEIERALGLRP